MFIVIAGSSHALDTIASRLRGGDGPPRLWRGDDGGAAVMPPFLLPEDDLDAQPIVGDDRVFVGQLRIDNRDELLAELDVREPMADSTLASMAWDRWGEAALRKIAGDFSFVVWHPRQRRLIAVVDHHCERRLLWSQLRNGIVLSPQLAPLLAHPDVDAAPDLEALAHSFDAQLDRTLTPYANIHAIPGGHQLEWRDGDVRIRRWWQPDTTPSARGDIVEEAGALFDRAVRARLRAKGTIAATLSGGLDSGLVTATAARQLGDQRLGAFTSVPTPGLARCELAGWDADDGPYAAEVAAMYPNIDHRLVSADGRCMLDLFAKLGTPTRHSLNYIWLDPLLESLAANGTRVMLTGQMGNATISWSGAVAAPLRRLASSIKRRVLHRHRTPGGMLLRRERRPRPVRAPSGSRADWIAFATRPHSIWIPDSVEQWGVELRDPTIDRRLVECLLRFPPEAFRVGGEPRGLARALATGRLPDRVRLRRTRGAQVPEVASLIAIHAARYYDALRLMQRSAGCQALFDLAAVRDVLDRLAGGALDDAQAIMLNRAFDIGLFLCRSEGLARSD